MPQVDFRSADGEVLEASVDAPSGALIADLCDGSDASVPFSCRSATCGTCRIVILEGAELLVPAEDEELALLDVFGAGASNASGAGATQRFACQACVQSWPGRVVLRPVADDDP